MDHELFFVVVVVEDIMFLSAFLPLGSIKICITTVPLYPRSEKKCFALSSQSRFYCAYVYVLLLSLFILGQKRDVLHCQVGAVSPREFVALISLLCQKQMQKPAEPK